MNESTEEPDEMATWQTEIMALLKSYSRDGKCGVGWMLNQGLIDAFDALAVIPALFDDFERQARAETIARERQRRLDEYRIDWARIRREEKGQQYERT